MELSGWDCPWAYDWFPGDDTGMLDWDYGAGDVFGDIDLFQSLEKDIETRQESRVFRPFLSLATVESVVPAMNALINKRALM